MKGLYDDLSTLFRRTKLVRIAVLFLFVVLLFFLWKMQIIEHRKYWARSESNRIRQIIIPAPRGLIKDRNGEILAKNITSFRVSLIRENIKDPKDSLKRISDLLKIDPSVLEERIDKFRSLPLFQPIVIKDNLTQEDVARIEVRKLEFPELLLQTEPKRFYPHGTLAAHVLGYMQEVSLADLQSGSFPGSRGGDLLGKSGIERTYESKLAGVEGLSLDIVDNVGRVYGALDHRAPIPGTDVLLTLDARLQRKTEEALVGREGAIVILNPQNGDILAMASSPSYDPNRFINRFSLEEWQQIAGDPATPLQNRAIQGLYSPGSIFKLTMAAAGLELGLINTGTTVFCSGETVIYNNPFRCWYEYGHGSMNLVGAIQNSCNIYFYQLGRRMGIDNIADFARRLGFGSQTNVDIPGEKAGLVPDPEWSKETRNAQWYPGETISVSIGQGPLNVTALQVAYHTSIFANKGKRFVPHFLRSLEKKELESVSISQDTFEKVILGMRQSSSVGTSRAAGVPGFEVCGKTGSTQVVSRETAERLSKQARVTKTHSWFSGFASMSNPQVVITVIVEYGGMGGAEAAPLAGQLFRAFKEYYD